MNLKKSKTKTATNEFRYFLESNLVGLNRLFVLLYLNRDNDAKWFKIRRYYLPKGIIKNYNVKNKIKNQYRSRQTKRIRC